MIETNSPKSASLLMLLIAITLSLFCQVYAAKITIKATTTNSGTVSKNSSNEIEKASIVPATVVVPPITILTESMAETKENINVDLDKDSENKNHNNADDDDDDDKTDDGDDNEDETEKIQLSKNGTELQPAEKDDDNITSTFSDILRTMWNWLKDDISESLFGNDETNNVAGVTKALMRQVRDVSHAAAKFAVESRTFGKIRRLQMALIPLIFKFGMLTAMVAFLIMLGMKTLFLVKFLVLMNVAAIFAKIITAKSHFVGHEEHHGPAWAPQMAGGWVATAPVVPYGHHEHVPSKEIHLHIHGAHVEGYDAVGQGSVNNGYSWESRSDPYSAFATTNEHEVKNELDNIGPSGLLKNHVTVHQRL